MFRYSAERLARKFPGISEIIVHILPCHFMIFVESLARDFYFYMLSSIPNVRNIRENGSG